MTLKEFFIKLFTAESGISSKRFFGALGWLICLGILIYCTITKIQSPEITDSIIIASTTLLGVDSIVSIWRK